MVHFSVSRFQLMRVRLLSSAPDLRVSIEKGAPSSFSTSAATSSALMSSVLNPDQHLLPDATLPSLV